VCGDAAFEFESIVPTTASGLAHLLEAGGPLWSPTLRIQAAGIVVQSNGTDGDAADITELYSEADKLPLRKQGLYTVTNWVALRQMVNIGRDRQES
jgi:hypothetical protein